MADTLQAATRDTSRHPGRFHIATDHWMASCDTRVPLAEPSMQPADRVPLLSRCRRAGCRGRWPAEVRDEDQASNTRKETR